MKELGNFYLSLSKIDIIIEHSCNRANEISHTFFHLSFSYFIHKLLQIVELQQSEFIGCFIDAVIQETSSKPDKD
jgi:hypothetical protein